MEHWFGSWFIHSGSGKDEVPHSIEEFDKMVAQWCKANGKKAISIQYDKTDREKFTHANKLHLYNNGYNGFFCNEFKTNEFVVRVEESQHRNEGTIVEIHLRDDYNTIVYKAPESSSKTEGVAFLRKEV